MQCLICRTGNTQPGETSVTLHRGDSLVIFKGVPANICDNCGEYYLSDEVTKEIMDRAEAAVRNGAEVEVQRFAA